MLPKNDQQLFTREYYNQEKFSDVVTKRKISKHLSDINDTISEDDIKNVKTNFGNAMFIAETIAGRKKEDNN